MFKKTVRDVVAQKSSNMVNLELVKKIFLLKDLKLSSDIFVSDAEILFLLTEKVKIFILLTNLSVVRLKELSYLETA